MNCCNERGYYLDPRCLKQICDHRIKTILKRNKRGLPCVWGTIRMTCPRRPCKNKCEPSGFYTRRLARRLRMQARRLRALESV